jgi:hypothetical protein
LTFPHNRLPCWYFTIQENDNQYLLKIHHSEAKEYNISQYLNKWDQIEDFKIIKNNDNTRDSDSKYFPQYFLVQVNRPGSKNLTLGNAERKL